MDLDIGNFNNTDLTDLLDLICIVYSAYLGYEYVKQVHKKRRTRVWVRELNLNRHLEGFFEKTFQKMKEIDPEQFSMCTRMNANTFDLLLTLLKERLTKYSIRTPISPSCRLFLTLMYLSQGASRQLLAVTFKLGVSTVRSIVLETCEAIWDELCPIYLSPPNTNELKRIGEDFKNIWNLPNCVGAIDGKHVNITCPHNSGSQYFNYKETYSIVLLAICDANYTFTFVDIGAYGSQSDGGVLSFSQFGKALLSGNLKLPEPQLLGNSDIMFPHYIVGDAAFPLKTYLMRPYPGRLLDEKRENYNKRLSRPRRTIENAFGILTARWRILRSTMNMSPDSAEKVVKAAVVLHNFVKMHDLSYSPPEFTDHWNGDNIVEGLWRQEIRPLRSVRNITSNNAPRNAFECRNILCDFLYQNPINE